MKNSTSTPTTNRGVENTCKYPVIVDWLTFSGHFCSFQEMIEFLGLTDSGLQFEENGARGFYQSSINYNDELVLYLGHKAYNNETKKVEYDASACKVDISGKGCRDIESFSDFSLDELIFKVVSKNDFKVSRIDIAMDVINDKSFKYDSLIKAYLKNNFTCRSKAHTIIKGTNDGVSGISLYFGRKSSNIFINIYDKGAERGYKPDEISWTRFEVRLRHENAEGFCNKLAEGYDVGYLYVGVVNNYLRFVVNSTDSNKSRLKTAPYWDRLLSHTEQIKVFDKKFVEYDYSKFENDLFNSCGSRVLAYLKVHSVQDLQNELSMRNIKLNPKQQIIVDNYKDGIDYMIL